MEEVGGLEGLLECPNLAIADRGMVGLCLTGFGDVHRLSAGIDRNDGGAIPVTVCMAYKGEGPIDDGGIDDGGTE